MILLVVDHYLRSRAIHKTQRYVITYLLFDFSYEVMLNADNSQI